MKGVVATQQAMLQEEALLANTDLCGKLLEVISWSKLGHHKDETKPLQ